MSGSTLDRQPSTPAARTAGIYRVLQRGATASRAEHAYKESAFSFSAHIRGFGWLLMLPIVAMSNAFPIVKMLAKNLHHVHILESNVEIVSELYCALVHNPQLEVLQPFWKRAQLVLDLIPLQLADDWSHLFAVKSQDIGGWTDALSTLYEHFLGMRPPLLFDMAIDPVENEFWESRIRHM
ncbi:MAG: hypothetical protein ABI947_10340 [Chloroflexota bacterium]